jgi:hypothetical protein
MSRRVLAIIAVLIFGLASLGIAAQDIRIAASIGDTHSMLVALNKVQGATWTPITDLVGLGMDFGLLTKGADNVFRSDVYFVVDAPVTSNHPTWTITHTRTNFQKDASNNLNDNTNVKFIKVDNTTNAETLLSNGFVSYTNSQSKVYANTDLTGSRLRIYYSLASGSGDATGVSVITSAKAAGNYSGTVTLTLSP